MWRLHQTAIPARLPRQRTVVHLTLTGAGAAEGWLGIQRGAVTVCTHNPGYDVDLAPAGAATARRSRSSARPKTWHGSWRDRRRWRAR